LPKQPPKNHPGRFWGYRSLHPVLAVRHITTYRLAQRFTLFLIKAPGPGPVQ
jgi:hypothetical protein